MELFRGVKVDWLGRKWYFLAFSLIFSVAGVLSMLFWHGIPLGVDFRGGTQVTVHFDQPPNDSGYHDSGFSVQQVDIVGPTAGKQLQHQAWLATIYSLIGMLIYLWFRFELIYGVAAVVAVFHDTLITVGFFSLTNQEITLTVIAAILTLIGYSMNDTIVVFDRIRENLALSRRETLSQVVNRSINQTLSRTVLTSGLTFLTVLSLYLFGGEVLHGFSFALVVGILIGTYSSIAVAAPMLVAYQDWRAAKGKRAALPAAQVVRR